MFRILVICLQRVYVVGSHNIPYLSNTVFIFNYVFLAHEKAEK
jgi:hypothetical protein